MKTIMYVLATIFSLSSCTSIYAAKGDQNKNCQSVTSTANASGSSLQANIFQNATGRVTVILMQPEKAVVTISITDRDNNMLYKEKLETDSARQNFDLKHLDSGYYSFVVNRSGECFVKTIHVN